MRSTKLFLAGALAMATAFSGGFWVEFGSAKASSDPKAKGALAIVRALGCHEPEKAGMSATAEGIVNGKRVSRPIEVVMIQPGTFALKGDVPSDGHWVIAATASYNGMVTSSAAPVESDGSLGKVSRYNGLRPPPEKIDALLAQK